MLRGALQGAAWLASVAALAYEFPAGSPGIARVGASALPFLLLCGLPRSAREAREPAPARAALLWLALAAGPLLLAARLDLASARAWPLLLALLGASAGAIFVLAWSSARAGGGAWHTWTWFAAIVGAPALAAVIALAPGGAPRGGWSAWLAHLSPLEWTWRASCESDPLALVAGLLPALGLALLAVAARRPAERAP